MLPEQLHAGHVLAIALQIAACMQSSCKLRTRHLLYWLDVDARNSRPRCCRLPRPKEKWALPFEIVRQHPERPSLIKSRPTIPFSLIGRNGARMGLRSLVHSQDSALFTSFSTPACSGNTKWFRRCEDQADTTPGRRYPCPITDPIFCAASGCMGATVCTSPEVWGSSWRRPHLAALVR